MSYPSRFVSVKTNVRLAKRCFMNTQILMIVLAVLMIAVSIYYGLQVISIYRRRAASGSWSTAAGNVLSREVSSHKNSKTHSYSYRAEVTYSYAAPGGPFEKKLFLGSKGIRAQAEKLLDAIGDTIQVRYNPEKPAEHISDHEKILPAQVAAIIGGLFLAVILIVLSFI
jgi:hypothetical protein